MKDIVSIQQPCVSDPFEIIHDFRKICKVRRRKLLRKINRSKKNNIQKIEEVQNSSQDSNGALNKATFEEDSIWDVLFDKPGDFKGVETFATIQHQEESGIIDLFAEDRNMVYPIVHQCPEKQLLFREDFPECHFPTF